MKIIATFFSILLLATANLVAAPNTTTIKGVVVDKETLAPLSYATVAVRNDSDQVVAAATANEDGSFVLNNVPYGSYRLVATFIGYKEHDIPVQLNTSEMNAGTIEMEEDVETLETAVITAAFPS